MTKQQLTPEEEERADQLIHTMAVLQEKWAEKFENPSLPSSLEAIDEMIAVLQKELDEIDPTTYEVWTVDPDGIEQRHLSCVNDFTSCQEKMNSLLDEYRAQHEEKNIEVQIRTTSLCYETSVFIRGWVKGWHS